MPQIAGRENLRHSDQPYKAFEAIKCLLVSERLAWLQKCLLVSEMPAIPRMPAIPEKMPPVFQEMPPDLRHFPEMPPFLRH